MFGRQWFSSRSQIGLSQPALQMQQYLIEHRFSQAADLAKEQSKIYPAYWRRQYKRVLHLNNRFLREERFGPQPLSISFSGFWPDMDPSSCQLLDLFRLSFPQREIHFVDDSRFADISLFSCYGDLSSLKPSEHSLRILFLGENVRPCYEHFDYSLSTDIQSYSGLNCYLPLWLFEIDWFGKQYNDRKTYPLSLFTTDRFVDYSNRLSHIVYVGNNHEPYRISALNTIQAAGYTLHLYGSHSRPIDDKIQLCSSYRFCFCPENSYFPGYVTEKLIHSYLAATIPIYWGCLDSQPFQNHPLIIQLKASDSDSQLAHMLHSSLQPYLQSRKSFNYPKLLTEADARGIFNNSVTFVSAILRQFFF